MSDKKSENRGETSARKPVKLKGWLIALCVCVIALVVLCVLKTNTSVCEFLARTFSRAWVWFFSHIFGWLPISMYELLILAAVAGAVFSIVRIIINLKRKEGLRALRVAVIAAVACTGFASVYTATASVCYNRNYIPLGQENFTVSDETLFDACEYYVTKLNEVSARLKRDSDGIVENPYTTKELGDILQNDFRCLDEFDGFFSPYTPQAKGMASSFFMSALSLTGITFVPFGEPNVNTRNPACDLPHTMAHEMAHSKGVMREYEANIVANYVCLNSSDDFVLYSGLTHTVYDLLSLYVTQTGDSEGAGRFLRYDRRRYKHGKICRIFVLDKAIELFFGHFRMVQQSVLKAQRAVRRHGQLQGAARSNGAVSSFGHAGRRACSSRAFNTYRSFLHTDAENHAGTVFGAKIKRASARFFIDFFHLRPAPSQSPLPHFAFPIA